MSHWEIAFTGTWPALPVVLLGLMAAGMGAWFYRSKQSALSTRNFCILVALRVLVILIVALFMLQPVLRLTRTETTPSSVLLLVDESESMGIEDAANDVSRLDAARMLLLEKPYSLLRGLEESQKVTAMGFGAVTQTLDGAGELRELRADSKATAIGDALREAAARSGSENVAGIVLLTDGVSNRGEEPQSVARTLGVPVFAVGLGGRVGERGRFRDVGIVRVPSRPQFVVNNTAALDIELSHRGLTDFMKEERRLDLRLLNAEGEVLATTTIDLPPEDGTLASRLEFVPKRVGVHRLRVEAVPMPGETVRENNARSFTALVTDPRVRVLIVEGVVRSEYRFLRRVLESDPNLEVTSVVKLAGNRFLVQGSQPGVDLSRGLPASRDDLDEFDVVVLGDVGREEFSGLQLEYLKDYVDAGGAVLVLGGYHAFGAGGYAESALADVLPVSMGGTEDGHVEESFVPVLTGAGAAHPVFAGCARFFQGSNEAMALAGANRVLGAKPGAQVLALHPFVRGRDGPMPVVAVQAYGLGRAMAMTADTTWKWKFQVESLGEDSPYYRFWRQSIRWLAGRTEEDTPDRLVTAWPGKVEYAPEEAVLLKARVLNREKQPEESADVRVRIAYPIPVKPKGADADSEPELETTVRLSPVPLSPGDYQVPWRAPAVGLYRASATAMHGGDMLGTADFEFVVGEAAGEFDNVDVDETTLRALAAQTGGAYFTMATAGRIPEELRQRRGLVVRRRELNLWNAPGFFAALLACATAEWILRKRRGLN